MVHYAAKVQYQFSKLPSIGTEIAETMKDAILISVSTECDEKLIGILFVKKAEGQTST